MKMKITTLLVAVFLVAARPAIASAALAVRNPRCDYQVNPIDVDSASQHLSWTLESDQRAQRQTAYQILVATSRSMLDARQADLWDSGKVPGNSSIQIRYAGKPLVSRQTCFWTVHVWDQSDQASDWSEPASWAMGLSDPKDWQAQWISSPAAMAAPATRPVAGPMPIFRHEFTVTKNVRRAVVYISGMGQFELRLNGSKVGKDLLQPGWTDYRKTCLYVAYDVTDQIRQGSNALGVVLGNGMYDVPAVRYHKFVGSFGPPMMIAELHLDYADGTRDTVASDASWKVTDGPITYSSIYGGEDFDARLEPIGWDSGGFNDSTWTPAAITAGPGPKLAGSSRSAPPIRVMQILRPQKITHPQPDTWVYDMGQNCAMIPHLIVTGPAGAVVRLTPGELLSASGTVSQASSGSPSYDTYTLRGEGNEDWSPRFTYYGSRYIQIAGAAPPDTPDLPPEVATVQSLQGLFICGSDAPVGEFSCSNDLFNRTDTLIRWAIQSNMMSILTDCPHRERLGWLEQDHLVGPSLMFNFDIAEMYAKICGDMREAQLPNGLVPDIAPEFTTFQGGFRDSPEWGSSAVLVPWQLYDWYGDQTVLEDNFSMMQRYVAYLGTTAKDNIIDHGLGDWYDIGPRRPGTAQLTPIALTATAFYYRDIVILAQAARSLNHPVDAQQYDQLAIQVRGAFNHQFYDPKAHRYATGSQTANSIPLVMGLAPAEDAAAVVQNIVQDIRDHQNSLTAGDVGYRYLLRALADGGRSDVIFDMNNQVDRPGYGYQLAHGATSLTEAWNTDPRSSQDHFMLGHIMEWFYGDLAGIAPAPDSVAFSHVLIHPAMVGDLTWAKATYKSVAGPITSNWKREAGHVTLDVTIPANCTATIFVPAASADAVEESGQPAASAIGVHFVKIESGAAIFDVQSGHYVFTAR
jgi:hypothetical protein